MATKKLAMTTLAATLTLAACASPYADSIKQDTADCQAGIQLACDMLPHLRQADADWHAEQDRNAALAIAVMGVGLAAGAAAYSASRPTYVAPAYVYTPPVNCYSSTIGMYTNTSCY